MGMIIRSIPTIRAGGFQFLCRLPPLKIFNNSGAILGKIDILRRVSYVQ